MIVIQLFFCQSEKGRL